MKKTILVLAVLMLAVPAMAGITVTAAQVGDTNVVQVSYAVTGDVNRPRAFALDVNISPASSHVLAPYGFDPNFYVAPGTFSYDDVNGVKAWGTRFTLATNAGFTTEMGSLWHSTDVNHPTQPPLSGTLFSFTVTTDCTVTLAENALRGGVVMQDIDANYPDGYVTLTGGPVVLAVDCYQGPDHATWVALGEPACWCYPSQCHGDIDGATEAFGKGTIAVGYVDLNLFLGAWLTDNACSDLDHQAEAFGKGTVRVGYADLSVLLANWLTTPATDCNAP